MEQAAQNATNSDLISRAAELAKYSDSTIIILLVVIVILILALIPVMKTTASINQDKKKYELDRENTIIRVVQDNTEVIASLKTLIETDQKFCADCKNDQMHKFRKIFDNQETVNVRLAEISACLKRGGNEDERKTG